MKSGEFPQSVQIGRRAIGWHEFEVTAFLTTRRPAVRAERRPLKAQRPAYGSWKAFLASEPDGWPTIKFDLASSIIGEWTTRKP